MKKIAISLLILFVTSLAYSAEVGKCIVPRALPKTVCKLGDAGKFCFSTPEFGVTADYIDLDGTLDLSQGLANLSMAVQHVYTGQSHNFTARRCESCGIVGDFCITNSGKYCAKIPLSEFGAYSVKVTASFLDNTETAMAKFSRILEPNLNSAKIEITPSIDSPEILNSSHLTLKVKLLDGCEQCDFIGSATGAIFVKSENKISSSDGTSVIACETNIEQGGSGEFSIGVPISTGANEIVLKVCSNAFGDKCRVIKNINFGDSNVKNGVEIISPAPMPSYSDQAFKDIQLSFKWNAAHNECLTYEYNMQSSAEQSEICPVNGVYNIPLMPRKGVNALVVRKGGDSPASWPWFFGWGKIDSPFDNKGWNKEELLKINIPKNIILDLLLPKLNEYLNSSKFFELVENIGKPGEGASTEQINEDEYLPNGCVADSSSMEIKIADGVKIGTVVVKNVMFEDGKLSFRIVTDDVSIPVDVSSNFGELPLRIGWRKAAMDFILLNTEDSGEKHLELSGPHSDCDYRKKPYCENKPAVLIPANLIGDGRWGQFIHCDKDRRPISGKLAELCVGVESINAQTGLVHDKVIQAINDLIRCKVTSALNNDFELNLHEKVPPVVLSVPDSIEINSNGINLKPYASIGSSEFYSNLPNDFKHPSVGVIKEESVDYLQNGFSIGIALQVINKAIFGFLAKQNGTLNFDIDEKFIKENFGFDFETECSADATNADSDGSGPSTFCLIRPRVQELLGSSLSSYGYFDQKQPLLLKVKMNLALPPHVSIAEGYSNALDIAIGGISVYFYPIATGNQNAVYNPDDNEGVVTKNSKLMIADWTGTGKETPIIGFGVGLFARVEIAFDGHSISLKLLGSGTRLFMSALSGTNATTVPDELLVDTIRGKLVAALDGYTADSAKPLLVKEIGDRFNLPDPVSGWYLEWSKSELLFDKGWIKFSGANLKNGQNSTPAQ